MLLKNGVGFFYVFDPEVVSREFPLPLPGPDASSFGWPLVVWVLQLDTYRGLWLIPLSVILISALALAPILTRRFDRPTAFTIALVLLLGPIPMSLLSHLGRHDFLVVIGGVALALSLRRPALAAGAAVVMSLGNPEQAMVAAILLLAAVLITRNKELRSASISAVLVAGTYWFAVSLFLTLTGNPSRIGTLNTVIPDASRIALSNLPVLVWSTYGLSTFALLALIVSVRSWRSVALLSVAAVPIALYFMGDQTRVGIATATPLIVFATIAVVENVMCHLRESSRTSAVGAIALATAVVPSVHILYVGGVFEPYTFIVDILT